MKKIKIIILSLLGILLVAAAVIGIWQRDNIVSFVNSVRYSETELTAKLEDNSKKLQEIVDKTEYIDIRGGLTEEEEKALHNNEITADDAVKLIRGQSTLEQIKSGEMDNKTAETTTGTSEQTPNDGNNTANPDNSNTQSPSKEDTMKDNVSDIVAQLYVVKSDFVNRLNGIGAQAYETYKANGSDKASLTSIAESYAPAVGALETECDNKVNVLLSQLESELKKGGGDLALVNQIRQYYYNEKSLTKSYYINKYMK